MPKSNNKGGHASSFTSSAGKKQSTKKFGNHGSTNKDIHEQTNYVEKKSSPPKHEKYASPYENAKQNHKEEKIEKLRERGYDVWHNPNDDQGHLHVLIKKHKQAASIVGVIGLTISEPLIALTGFGNAARCMSWEWNLKNLPSRLANITTAPTFKLADTMFYASTLMEHYDTTKNSTKGIQNWLNDKAKSIEQDSQIKFKAIELLAKNKIGRDILKAPINYIHSYLGAAAHMPQGYYGVQQYLSTGELNGHLGVLPVIVGYGALGCFHKDRIPKLKKANQKYLNEKKLVWDNKTKHTEMGFFDQGQYAKYITLVAAPVIFFNIKGVAYAAEGIHELPWSADEMVQFPKQTYEILSSMDLNTAFNSAINADYSNIYSASISLAWIGAGAIFAQSAWGELKEDVLPSAKYAFDKYITEPANIKMQQIKHDFEEIIGTGQAVPTEHIQEYAIKKLQPHNDKYHLLHINEYEGMKEDSLIKSYGELPLDNDTEETTETSAPSSEF